MAAALSGEWWVKGGDLYASRREDVQRVTTAAALEQTLDDFAARGLESAVLQQHVRGREIKFYAVGGSGFFYWLDTDDPTAHGTSAEPFQRAAILAGTTLSLEVFGGDLVIGEDGRATLIDLNDWPSFAPCRRRGRCCDRALPRAAGQVFCRPFPGRIGHPVGVGVIFRVRSRRSTAPSKQSLRSR